MCSYLLYGSEERLRKLLISTKEILTTENQDIAEMFFEEHNLEGLFEFLD
jgi:hypothetical protein